MKTAKLRIDPSRDYRGMVIYANMPFQPLPTLAPEEPTALMMSIDLLKAKIAAKVAEQYTPSEIEYQKRLLESAKLNRTTKPC